MLCDAYMQVPDAQQPPADLDIDRDDPCPEDEEFFDRPDAATMEEAISRFMDGMEAQECCGFKDCHRLLERLPVPTVKPSQPMTDKLALLKTQYRQGFCEVGRALFTPQWGCV